VQDPSEKVPVKAPPPKRPPPKQATQVPNAASAKANAPAPKAGGGSTGGQGTDVANVQSPGIEFPFPTYLNNIANQVIRNFARTNLPALTCDVSAGIGLVVFQKQDLRCTFHPAKGGPDTYYTGQIADYGVALGAVKEGYLVWGVIAATKTIAPGALAGTYAGVGAQATAGIGVGANLLVGGTGNAFSLQPLAVQGQVGVNVAAGVTSVTLIAVP